MQDDARRRRFIAGAVCPRCGEMDKIVVDRGADQRQCIACGFSDRRPGSEQPGSEQPGNAMPGDDNPVNAAGGQARELPTRVSRAAARLVDTPAEPINLIDPGDESG